jgi:Rieske 2Fe-2S family protein
MNAINLRHLLEGYRSGWGLEQAFYTDQGVFDLEWEHIWKKYWLFAGTTAEIPRAGDYFIYTAQKDSIIIIRGNKGEVYAHYNTCRQGALNLS